MLHAKKKKRKKRGETWTFDTSANHKLSAGDLFLFAWCNLFKTVSTNILLYCHWTKKIFVIFSAVFCVYLFLNGGKDKLI